VIKAKFVLSGFEAVLDSPAMAFHGHLLLHGVPLGHHVEKKAKLPSAMLRPIRRPRVLSPASSSLHSLASR
jgi:hypothetical protein